MATQLRSSVRGVVGELSRSLGTFVGLAWVCAVVGLFLARATGLSSADHPLVDYVFVFGVLLAAAVATGWLADGGYERLGADPAGGAAFAWLAIVFLPLSFLPARIALDALVELPALDYAFVLATTPVAVWLAFYDGLERLGVEPADFAWVIVYALALGAVPAGAVALFDAAWLTAGPVVAAIAIGVQLAACWLGVARTGR